MAENIRQIAKDLAVKLENIQEQIMHQRSIVEHINDGGPGNIRFMKNIVSLDLDKAEDMLLTTVAQLENMAAYGEFKENIE